jgi:hypothetical protein
MRTGVPQADKECKRSWESLLGSAPLPSSGRALNFPEVPYSGLGRRIKSQVPDQVQLSLCCAESWTPRSPGRAERARLVQTRMSQARVRASQGASTSPPTSSARCPPLLPSRPAPLIFIISKGKEGRSKRVGICQEDSLSHPEMQ